MSESSNESLDSVQVAKRLAAAVEAAGCEYALGGALALGFWAQPRGTLDVDLTLFLPPNKPTECLRLLAIGWMRCDWRNAIQSLSEHDYCQVLFRETRIDVFLPATPFYEIARGRRTRVTLDDQSIMVWDAETLCVFKMMFFRRKDIADVEQVLRTQSTKLDRQWVRERIVEIYGKHDPRLLQWDELCREIH